MYILINMYNIFIIYFVLPSRNPPGFAFVVFKHPEDAEKVVRDLDGR